MISAVLTKGAAKARFENASRLHKRDEAPHSHEL
jgi:hypothetical protein